MNLQKLLYFAVLCIAISAICIITPLVIVNNFLLLIPVQIALIILTVFIFSKVSYLFCFYKSQKLIYEVSSSTAYPEVDVIQHSMADFHMYMLNNDIEKGFEVFLNHVRDILPGCSSGFVCRIEANDNLEFVTSFGHYREILSTLNINFSEISIFKEYNKVPSPVIIDELHVKLSKDYGFKDASTFLKSAKIKPSTLMLLPVMNDEKIVGITGLYTNKNYNFSKIDIEIMRYFSFVLGLSFKTKLYLDDKLGQMSRDQLTGIYTRSTFEEKYTEIQSKSMKNNINFSLAILDINNLREINETYGRAYGDLVLIRFVGTVNEFLSPNDVFARFGGDEFILLLYDMDKKATESLLRKLQSKIKSNQFEYLSKVIPVSFKYGVSHFPEESMILDILIKIADNRMIKNGEAGS